VASERRRSDPPSSTVTSQMPLLAWLLVGCRFYDRNRSTGRLPGSSKFSGTLFLLYRPQQGVGLKNEFGCSLIF
jgi:hypothetical protein